MQKGVPNLGNRTDGQESSLSKLPTETPPRPLGMPEKAELKGSMVKPAPFWNGRQWVEWIPWDEI